MALAYTIVHCKALLPRSYCSTLFERLSVSIAVSTENNLTTNQIIYDKLTAIFRDIFEDETIVLRESTSDSDIAGWDSFSNASLIAAIEKAFGLRFRTAELQTLHTAGDFASLVRAKLQTGV